jgi:hypothetical protein
MKPIVPAILREAALLLLAETEQVSYVPYPALMSFSELYSH